MARRLAIVSTHPIQYNAPVFRELAANSDLDVHVFFSWRGTEDQLDLEFGRRIQWDIPLTEGYAYTFVANVSQRPGTHHFMGLRNPNMCRQIAAFEPDAILVYGWSSWTHLSVLRQFKGRVPLLFRGDSTLTSSDRPWKAMLRRPVLTWVYRHIDRAFYVGQQNLAYFRAHGVPDDRLVWAPHSVDNQRFSSDPALRQATADAERASLGIPPEATVFSYAGKLVPRKQPALLIEAFKDASREADAFATHLIMIGTGPIENELRNLAEGQNNIHFLGFRNQSEMPTAYRLGDVFVLPSSRETWGLAVNEAMACARPVIVSDRVGCAPDLATDVRFSSIFRSGSRGALARALREWMRGRARTTSAGRLAQSAIAPWSTEAAAKAIRASVAEL